MKAKFKKSSLSDRQKSAFWAAFGAACRERGLVEKNERDEYRHQVLMEEAGNPSMKELDNSLDYDAVMAHFWLDAGDYAQASHYTLNAERRWAFNVKVCAIQLMQLKGGSEAEARRYLGAILDQAHLANGINTSDDSYWMDVNPANLRAVFKILDTARRRLIQRFLDDCKAVDTLSFRRDSRYIVEPSYNRVTVPREYYETAPFKVNLTHAA